MHLICKTRLAFFSFLFLVTTSQVFAQGIKGTISDTNGESLPFATIYVRNIETGTTSNDEGIFSYHLLPGKYDLVFQYLGYKSLLKFIEVSNDFVEINVQLEQQAIVLKSVEVRAGKEDPAYTIMRKAIAKSKFHLQQLDSYTNQVYIKGSGRLLKSPFFVRKQIAKEGIDENTAFTTESISKIKYTRPNTYEEHVVSIRNSGDDNNTSPIEYIKGSFYEPKIANAISPLSPKAFAYYKFEYLGTFRDRDFEVSKIRVIPRSKGDDVFEGEIFIVEELWSIHSLNMKTSYLGIDFNINQIYNPIQNKVWMPVSHKFDINGTFFGFEFEYKYLATASDYAIELNKDLEIDIVVIDEKIDKELASELKKQNKNVSTSTLQKMNSSQELTRKELRKVLKEYEKQEEKRDTIADIEFVTSVKVDSLANTKDSTFWNSVRPVPLNAYEIRGYQKADSMAIVRKNEAEGDTIKTKKGKEDFQLKDILFGNTYKIGDKAHLKLKSPLPNINFNTVEGYNFYYEMALTKTFDNKNWLEVAPNIRYAFSRNKITGLLNTTYKFGAKTKSNSFTLSGGRYVNQLNNNEPILPILNTLTSLLFEENYMKLYEEEFLSLQFNKKLSDKYRFNLKAKYTNRIPLSNTTSHVWFDDDNKEYNSNTPENIEIGNTEFIEHQAFLMTFNFTVKPWLKYYIKNSEKFESNKPSPEFKFGYQNALPIGGTDISYHKITANLIHGFDVGIRGKLNFNIGVGTFIKKENITFLDFNHFIGNRTLFQATDVVGSYHLLPYYDLSTSSGYFSLLTHYQFRKFFLSRFNFIRKRGIKESVFANYLGTDGSKYYTELGYSIDNIFRVFKVEGVTSFMDGKYHDWGIRIGITSGLDQMFNFE